jgi:phosphoribosyl 1,2-cyclic phosphate phosphodiesterase
MTFVGDETIHGDGGPITFEPFEVNHGSIDALGFRIGNLVYLPDVAEIPAPGWEALKDLDIWIIDALRRTPHPTHFSLDDALHWIMRTGAKQGVVTNMHIDLDHATVEAETPDNVSAAFDGMVLPIQHP